MIANLEFGFTFVDTLDFIPPFWWFGFGLKKTAPLSFLPFDLHEVMDFEF